VTIFLEENHANFVKIDDIFVALLSIFPLPYLISPTKNHLCTQLFA